MSHTLGGYAPDGAHRAIRGIASHIKALTGHEPPSCPWRAFYDPIVSEVVDLCNAADEGLGVVGLDDDAPAVLIDALRVYVAARRSTRAHYEELLRKKHEREMERHRANAKRRGP